jgi:hypothetical protein
MSVTSTTPPTTIDQVHQLPHEYARTHAGALVVVSAKLPAEHGPITSKKLFMEGNKLVYEFYRARNKGDKFYIIF